MKKKKLRYIGSLLREMGFHQNSEKIRDHISNSYVTMGYQKHFDTIINELKKRHIKEWTDEKVKPIIIELLSLGKVSKV